VACNYQRVSGKVEYIYCYLLVTNKPKKDSDKMKHDSKTHIDGQERLIGITADHTSRPDKVLFSTDPHFLFFNSRPTFGTLSFARHTS
jgi:hypothetical protein